MAKAKKTMDIWVFFSLLIIGTYVLFLIYPLFRILGGALKDESGRFSLKWFRQFFEDKYYIRILMNSFKVSISATIVTLLLGYPMAYFFNMYEIKAKKLVQILVILSAMSPPFIGAYAWIQLLGRSGFLTRFIERTTGIVMPTIYGFNGIVLVLTLQLLPLVFMYIGGALKKIDRSLLEASANMGVSGVKRFFKVIVPLTIPTVLAAALLVFMRAFSDFGTPLLIGEGYRVFTVEIYQQFMGEVTRNYNFAATISIITVIITTIIFLVQKYMSKHFSYSMHSINSIERKKAKGLSNILIHGYVYFIVFLSFLPQLLVTYQSFQNTSGKLFVPGFSLNSYKTALFRVGSAIPNTLFIGGLALILTILISVFIAYLVVRRSNVINNIMDTISMIPYIVPGSVVAIGLIMAFSRKPLVLTGTVTIMVISLIIRRSPYTIRSSVAILQQIPMTVEEAAISLGASKLKTFFKITIPMMATGIISGAILSWVTIITELSGGILLYSSKTQTLTLAIYSFVSRGSYGYAAALSTILMLFTTVSLLTYMKVTKSDEINL